MLSYNSLATNYQLQVCQKRWEGSYWLAHETTKKINHLSLIIVLLLWILSLPLGPHAVQKYLVALTNVAMAYLERRGEMKFDLATTTQFTVLLFAASSDIGYVWYKRRCLFCVKLWQLTYFRIGEKRLSPLGYRFQKLLVESGVGGGGLAPLPLLN